MRVGRLVLALPWLVACGAEAPAEAPGDAGTDTTYVGIATSEGPDAGKNMMVAFVVGCDSLQFFLCGDEAEATTSPHGQDIALDTDSGTFATGGYYPGDGQFDGVNASGTLAFRDEPERIFHWQATAVANDAPTGPGLYSDGGACPTWFIVGQPDLAWDGPTFEGYPALGSGCTTESTANPRAQVTPILEMSTGYRLEIESIARRVEVARVTACHEP